MAFDIEGPYSFKDANGLKTPVYIFAPGGVRLEIGVATVTVDGGMTFEVELDEPYRDSVAHASFDVPMRFSLIRSKE